MPIQGLTEQVRMPRLGKIHLGVKVKNAKGTEYPSATDYFVCPEEVRKVHGEKPTVLPIIIPVEDADIWASQYYRAYSNTRGLTCRGDGMSCRRMIDTKTGAMANRDTKTIEWREATCDGRECPDYKDKKCSEKMCLQFMLPDVPGIGVWQIDTGSINSIRNINSAAAMIKGICGRVRMIPLLLSLGKQEVLNPDDGKKKMVNVLSMTHKESLHKLLTDSVTPIHELLAPVPDDTQDAPLDEEGAGQADIEQAEQDAKDYFPPSPKPVESTSSPDNNETEGKVVDWIKESLATIRKKKVAAYEEATLLGYMKRTYKVEAPTVLEAVGKLEPGPAKHFVDMIQDTLDLL